MDTRNKLAIVDADLVAFRCASSSEHEQLHICLRRVDIMMRSILGSLRTKSYQGYLTGSDNFRKQIDPQYKANRKDKPRPVWLEDAREYLVTEYGMQVTDGIEADDALGINQDKESNSTIICSIDKDLKQIPGLHYNFVKEEISYVTPWEGLQFFYKQALIGDTADNIFGVKGIGPKKADKLIDPCTSEEEMYSIVRKLYNDDTRFHRNLQLLHIMQKEGDIWEPKQELLVYYDQHLQKLAAERGISEQSETKSSESTSQETSGYTVSGMETDHTD